MRDSYVQALTKFAENGHVQEKFEPDYLIGQLRKRGVITQAEADDILSKSSRLQRQQELLTDFLPKRDDGAFEQFLDVMDSEQYHWAREILEHIYEKEQLKSAKQKSSHE